MTAQSEAPSTPRHSPLLDGSDLRKILNVLADCEGMPSLTDFRHAVTESLARHLGYRNTAFFVASAFADLNADRDPVAMGRAAKMTPSYIEEFHRNDPLVQLSFWTRRGRLGPMSLDEITGSIRPSHRRYLDSFLFRNGIHAKVVIPLVPGSMDGGGTGAIGWLAEESGAFGPRDLAIAHELHRHLTGLFRHHAAEATTPEITRVLSPRQREVAELVAEGKSNREIAKTLYIGIDTVKKHLTQVLRLTGCENRTQFAIKYGTGQRGPNVG